ncbi:MAG: DUF4864 domain-containing protein [Rhizobiaceae bacterium]|nr:DUF4864 domain-containing protein [Rhizobiaceae bacterium]
MKNALNKLLWPILIVMLATGLSRAQTGPSLPSELQTVVQSIIGGQINAFKTRDHEAAFGYAAPSIQQMFGSTDQFIGMVKNGYGAIYGARNWSFGRGEAKGDALIQEVMIIGPQGLDWVALYTLRKQADGTWRIAGVQMKPAELRNT